MRKKWFSLIFVLMVALSASVGASAVYASAEEDTTAYAPEAADSDAESDGGSSTVIRAGGMKTLMGDGSGDLVIMLDPGHGGRDAGATNKTAKLSEADITLKTSKACRDRLLKYDKVKAYLTHEGVAADQKVELDARMVAAQKVGADIFISLHINAKSNSTSHGAEIYVPWTTYKHEYNAQCTELATRILNNLHNIGLTNRGVKTQKSSDYKYRFADGTVQTADYYFVVREPISRMGIPGILIEHAYIVGDADFLRKDANLVSMGTADADAIAAHYGLLLKPGNPTDGSAYYQGLAVTQQPSNVAVKDGEKPNLGITATGSGLSYLWYYKKVGETAWSRWGYQSTSSITSTANESWNGMQAYCIVKDSSGRMVSSNAVTISVIPALTVTKQPEDIITKSGRNVDVAIEAAGSNVSYQWYYKKTTNAYWQLWKGHTSPKFTATANDSWDGMEIFCALSDSYGQTTSTVAALITIAPQPIITAQPADVITTDGAETRLSVTAVGTGLTYQWYYKKAGASSWSVWKSHNTAETAAKANDSWDGMQVRCRVTDDLGESVYSQPAKIIVRKTLAIITQPEDITIGEGGTATFSVKATGNALVYQWYYKKTTDPYWKVWKGHTTPKFTATANATWDGMEVFCTVTDTFGETLSSIAAIVQLVPKTVITAQPADVITESGSEVPFSVKATGYNLTYQWYYKKAGASSWSVWKSHDTAETSSKANDSWDGMQVRCRITNGLGSSLYSNAAKIIVKKQLAITVQPDDVKTTEGSVVTFSVKAVGNGLTYQWYYKKADAYSWKIWSGHNTATTTATTNSSWDGMQVFCTVTDMFGESVSTIAAEITMTADSIITSQPKNVTAKAGETVSLRVSATGTGLSYQWYYKKAGSTAWNVWKGHNTAVTTATANESWNGMQVYCAVTDGSKTVYRSNTATITIAA